MCNVLHGKWLVLTTIKSLDFIREYDEQYSLPVIYYDALNWIKVVRDSALGL